MEKPHSISNQRMEIRRTPLDLAMPAGEPLTKVLARRGAKHGPTYVRAQQLNAKGYSLYKKGRLRPAAQMFEKATSLGASHYTAQFNLASTYARLAASKNGKRCDGAWFHRSIEALGKAMEMNRGRTTRKAEKDSDFDGIRQYPRFFELLTATTFDDAKDVKPYVVGKTYRTSCPGSSYYPVRTLTISANGRWSETTHANADELIRCFHGNACSKPAPKIEYAQRRGKWVLEDRTLVLRSGQRVERLEILGPGQIGDLYWPDPNDMSGDSEAEMQSSCYGEGTDL